MENSLYDIPRNIHTRWASMENPGAIPGVGGQSGFGRKGSACRGLKAGESFVMAHADGSGTIRRIWITINDRSPELLRGIVIRMYWDGEEKPAVEVPLGDFFCQSLGKTTTFQNTWFDNPEGRSFNCRIPMPFRKGFKITAVNESPKDLEAFFYDVNFTLGDSHGSDTGYFHAYFNHENPTTLRHDLEILPRTEGHGRFLGCSMGVIADMKTYGNSWWGEGEVKMYIDGDTDYPTLCGTGTEDYIGTGWGQGCYSAMWHGCPLAEHEKMMYSFYRLHGPDPVYFQSNLKVTIQQIGCDTVKRVLDQMKQSGIEEIVIAGDGSKALPRDMPPPEQEYILFERRDDWCSTAYFYLDKPSNDLPAIEPYEARVSGLTTD